MVSFPISCAKEPESYIGLSLYGVKIDESEALTNLVEQAKKLRKLPFTEKIEAVRKLAQDAMQNAYEGMCDSTNPKSEKCKEIVLKPHTLKEALTEKLGCCRYQASLLFILGFAAELGDAHFLQSAYVGESVRTCFNEIIDLSSNKRVVVSIFLDTLKNPKYDYTKGMNVFSKAVDMMPESFHSYHRVEKDPTSFNFVDPVEKVHRLYQSENSHRCIAAGGFFIFSNPHVYVSEQTILSGSLAKKEEGKESGSKS